MELALPQDVGQDVVLTRGNWPQALMLDLVHRLHITPCRGEDQFTHHGCKPTTGPDAQTPHIVLENIERLCGYGACHIAYRYDLPPCEASWPGQMRMMFQRGEQKQLQRFVKTFDANGTIAFRQDSIFAHLSMLQGFKPDAPYGLRQGQMLPASSPDQAVRGGIYFYGSLTAVPKSGDGKWTPYSASGNLSPKMTRFLKQGIITVLRVTNVIAGPKSSQSDSQWSKNGSSPRNACVIGCIIPKACTDALNVTVDIRGAEEAAEFLNEARNVIVNLSQLLTPDRLLFAERYVAGGVFLAHAYNLLWWCACELIQETNSAEGNARLVLKEKLVPFVRDDSLEDKRLELLIFF